MYEIYLERSAEKDLRKIPRSEFESIIIRIKALSQNPRPEGCIKLKTSDNFWRIRIRSYRIIYEIIDSLKRINIYKVKHRKDVYR
jgi:mRNA interferase RelE/StbE